MAKQLTEEELKKISEKLLKLINLSNDGNASEGERENARRFIANMMDKYGLSEKDIDNRVYGEMFCGFEEIDNFKNRWERCIYSKTLKAFGVFFMKVGSRGNKAVYSGRTMDIEIADAIACQLLNLIDIEYQKSRIKFKKQGIILNKSSYFAGVYYGLDFEELLSGVTEYKKGDSVKGSNGRDLMVISKNMLAKYQEAYEEATKFAYSQGLRVKNVRASSISGEGFEEGQRSAKNIKVSPMVNSGGGVKAIVG